jgi:hypothetical protein
MYKFGFEKHFKSTLYIQSFTQFINIVCGRWLAKALPCLLGYQGSDLDNEPPNI